MIINKKREHKKMGDLPVKYTKKELINQLSNEGTDKNIIQKIENLPEKVKNDNNSYNLNIIVTNDKNGVNYEINYFSHKIMEFLFSYKVYDSIKDNINDIEKSIQKLN